jgi:hypothetical protein
MQDDSVTVTAEQVLQAAEVMESRLRWAQTVPEHLLKHFAKRIWELRAAIVTSHLGLERLQQRITVVQNNMDVLDHYVAGGFTFEDRWERPLGSAQEEESVRRNLDGS